MLSRDHPAFDGHFPGRPVVPGVVLLDEALAAIAAATSRPAHAWVVDSVKFLMPAGPDTRMTIAHHVFESGKVRFEIHVADDIVASGTLSPHGA